MSQQLPITMRVRLVRPGARLPSYAHHGDAGLDLELLAWRWPTDHGGHFARTSTLVLNPGERALGLTGIAVELPAGHEGQVRGRSGRSMRDVLVIPGTVDAPYRGEIGVILLHPGAEDDDPIELRPGQEKPIAQLVVAPVTIVKPVLALELTDTSRAAGGFGSTDSRDPKGAA